MDFITVFLVLAGFGGFIVQYWKNEPPFCMLTELLALGALVCILEEYTNGLMEETPALVFVIAMVAVMVWSAWNMVSWWMPNKRGNKRR